MRILSSIIFASLLCVPLVAMDVPQDTKDPAAVEKSSATSQLQKLFATAQPVHKATSFNQLSWNPQGSLLAVVTDGEDPFIFDPRDNSVFVIPVTQQEGDAPKWAGHLDWNKSGRRIAIGRKSQTIFIFDVAKKIISHVIPPEQSRDPFAPTVAWSPTEENVLACCEYKGIVRKFLIPEESAEPVTSRGAAIFLSNPAAWSFGEENSHGMGQGLGYPTRLDWRNETLAMAYRYAALCMTSQNKILHISPYSDGFNAHSRAIACHPQKNIIACAFAQRKPRIVLCEPEGESLKIIATKDLAEEWAIFDISFSHDGRFLTMPYNKTILTLDAETLEELHTHPMGEKAVYGNNAQWNPQRTQLAFANSSKLFITQESETSE